jgi:hypothetical protein
MARKSDERARLDADVTQPASSSEIRQVYYEAGELDVGSVAAQQLHGGDCRSSGRQQVIDK